MTMTMARAMLATAIFTDAMLILSVLYLAVLRRRRDPPVRSSVTEIVLKAIYAAWALMSRAAFDPHNIRDLVDLPSISVALAEMVTWAERVVPGFTVNMDCTEEEVYQYILRVLSALLTLLSVAALVKVLDPPRRRAINICYISVAINAWTLYSNTACIQDAGQRVMSSACKFATRFMTLSSEPDLAQSAEQTVHKAVFVLLVVGICYALVDR